MPNPKRRTCRARQGDRRSHWNIEHAAANRTASALEKPWSLRHFASADGTYRGRKIIDIKSKKAEE
jgi:ribosomal protein L32